MANSFCVTSKSTTISYYLEAIRFKLFKPQTFINKQTMADQNYDAIVVGSGISGGWAAKELTEKGLKVLLLERGRNIDHIKDYVNANKESWNFRIAAEEHNR